VVVVSAKIWNSLVVPALSSQKQESGYAIFASSPARSHMLEKRFIVHLLKA